MFDSEIQTHLLCCHNSLCPLTAPSAVKHYKNPGGSALYHYIQKQNAILPKEVWGTSEI